MKARRHFTRFDQVDRLARAALASPDRGFMARLMMLCSLPRANPGRRLQYKRVNGPYTLIMTAVGKTGLPFGNLPRLLLAWVSTEAVRTQSRELFLGASLSGFMRKLDLAPDRWWHPGRADAYPQPDEAALQRSYPAGLRG